MTSGAVGVMEGRQCAPGDALGRPHHPIESPAIAGSAVAVPGGDAARQDAFNFASVKVFEGLRGHAEFLQPPEVEETLLRLVHHTVCVGGPFQINSYVYVKDIEAFHLLHCGLVDVNRGVLSMTSTISSLILLTLR